MSPAGKGGKLSHFLLPFLFPPCHSDSPSPSWLGILLAMLCRSPLGVTGDAGFSAGLTALLLLINIPVKNALIGMTQMAVREGNTQEWEQNAAQ